MSYKDVTRPAPAEYRTNQCTHDDADKAPCPICERDAEIARLKRLLAKAREKAKQDYAGLEAVKADHDRLAVKNERLLALLNESANARGEICAVLGEEE